MQRVHDAAWRGFASDNYAGVHPRVLEALAAVNGGHQVAYGEEPRVKIPFNALSEAKLILTDDLIRDALRADKLAKAQAANQNDEDSDEA